ncbi:MAG: RNA polymerase sigma-70 factor (ECF subfamily) [Planctomycetota bacterium]|jgi:RNA polymerase sigma-70 factor (ECF subfamily)
MTDGLSHPAFDTPIGNELEERLALIRPQLLAHLSQASRRVKGLEPEDLAQEVIARALAYRDKFDVDRALWPWLRQVAQRVIFDHRTSVARRAEEGIENDVPAQEQVPLLDSREELERVLETLRPVEREALLRFHQHGESVREIASAMDMPEGTVKSHLSRARRRLAELPDQETDHE